MPNIRRHRGQRSFRSFCRAHMREIHAARRAVLLAACATAPAIMSSPPMLAAPAYAAKDCFLDCTSNCNRVAPKSFAYCQRSCEDYCLQDDRRDGLSGSVDSSKAEVGLISAYDIGARVTGTRRAVPYGEDQPPGLSLPRGMQDALRSAVRREQ